MQSTIRRTRKRPHPDGASACLHHQPSPKIQKLNGASAHFPPPEFWDNLTHIPLTKRALRELARRQARPEKHQFVYHHETNLRRFARGGGPDLRDLRGYSVENQAMQRRQSNPQPRRSISTRRSVGPGNTNTTRSTTPYDRAFDQHLTQHGIYPVYYEHEDGTSVSEPENLQEIEQRALQSRRSLSPSRFTSDDFKEFKRQIAAARKEKQVSDCVVPLIEGTIRHPRCRSGGIPFGNLEPLTDGTIAPGNPDIYYGCRPERFRKDVLADLHKLVIPSTQRDLPALPNFSLAVKGPGGLAEVAERQARYDGALGARAMSAALSYRQENGRPDNNAYTIASTFHAGTLTMYTSHQIPGADQTEYVMTQVGAWALNGSLKTFVEGAGAYRNLREWAVEERNMAIKAANEANNDSPPQPRQNRSLQSTEAEDVLDRGSEDSADSQNPEDPGEGPSKNLKGTSKGKRPRRSIHRSTFRRRLPPTRGTDGRESSVDELAM